MADKVLTVEFVAGNTRPPLKLTEEQAMHLFHKMQEAFGWSGTIFTREDAEDRLEKGLTDEEWNRVRGTWEWKKGLPDILCERGWEVVDSALSEAGVEKESEED